MNDPKICRRCGAQLPPGAGPGAPCPRCLLQLGFEESSPSPAHLDLPDLDEVVRTFPQLEIIEHVGTGGMGVVYHARQKGLNRDVALKLLSAEAAADPAFAERFTREARALASLTHPAITSVYDFGQLGRFCYLVMEYVDGANLRQVMNAGGLSPREALAMVSRMCDALQYAHDHGVVHRDIKPENVLIDRLGNLKIIDFGLAKLLGQAPVAGPLTRTDQAMGTWHYMAPEQVERPQEVDHRADIFSLGVVFYELLTGELPLGRFSPPSQRVQIDVRLDDIVMRTLEKEPADRYQRAGQVKTDLDHVTETRGGPQLAHASAAAPEPPRRKSSGLKIFFIVVGFGLVFLTFMGCLAALFLAGTPSPEEGRSAATAPESPRPTALERIPITTEGEDWETRALESFESEPFIYSIDGDRENVTVTGDRVLKTDESSPALGADRSAPAIELPEPPEPEKPGSAPSGDEPPVEPPEPDEPIEEPEGNERG